MPASNRSCFVCGAKKPAWRGEESRAGRGVGVWTCGDCVKDPAAGWAKRKAAQQAQEKAKR